MLVRGLLGRLTAEVSKTTSHDLPQLAALAHRAALHRLATPLRPFLSTAELCVRRAGRSPRGFATAAATGGAKASSAVAAGKGAAGRKKSGAAGSGAKKAQRGAKAKAGKKKKKTTSTTSRKPLTEAQKARREHAKALEKSRLLKQQALLTEPKPKPASAWTVLFMEDVKKGGSVTEVMRSARERYRNLSALEREHYNHIANENKAANEAAYKAWVELHTPEQIRLANNARGQLRRQRVSKKGKRSDTPRSIKDDRLVKQPRTAYNLFFQDRVNSGDFKGVPPTDIASLVAKEYKGLSPLEKRKYDDLAAESKRTYLVEYERVYGHPAPSSTASSSSP